MSKGALGLLAAYWPEGTARYAHVPLQRVTQPCVFKTAESEAERVALRAGQLAIRYGELAERTTAVASALRERAEPGTRVALVLEDPIELLSCATGALEADLLVWMRASPPSARELEAFGAELLVARAPLPPVPESVAPQDLARGGAGEAQGRPKLRNPILALPKPGGGEVLHSHRTLVGTAISVAPFFLFEPGAELFLAEPPHDWLGVAVWLAAWSAGATVHAGWSSGTAIPERIDYWVGSWEGAEQRHALPGTQPVAGRIGAGALLGTSARFSTARRRRLSRRLRAPVLSVFGRNDLGPVIASHPTWFLDEAMGIPLPNVDLRPLDPADGRELSIGWDAVEEAEMGVKSALAPAGGELAGSWLRSREIVHVDPTGLYFFRRASGARSEP